MAFGGRRGGEDLVDGAVGQGLADSLSALGEEAPGLLPAGALSQVPSSSDPGRSFRERGFRARARHSPLRSLPAVGAGVGRRIGRTSGPPPGAVLISLVAQEALPCAGAFSRAMSTSAVNAAGSLTASSARIFRSTSMPATRSPWMNRL
jgi:hypothetical protein